MSTNYLIEQSVLLAVLGVFYYFLYRKNGNHYMNRIVLLSILALSIILPMISLDIFPYEVVISKSKSSPMPVEEVVNTAPQAMKSELNMIFIIYIIGVMLSLAHFILQIVKISRAIQSAKFQPKNGCFVSISEQHASFSFFKYIFMERKDDVIMAHELAHVKLRHSFDRIFLAIIQIVFWFNPLFYLYRYYIIENHELAADEQAINTLKIKRHEYGQYLLDYKIESASLTSFNNHFFSFIKNRINMLKEIKKIRKGAYLIITIAAFGLGCAFTFEDYPVYPSETNFSVLDTIPADAYYFDTTMIFDPQTYTEKVVVTKHLISESQNETINPKAETWFTNVDTTIIFNPQTYKEMIIIVRETYPGVISTLKSIDNEELQRLKEELGFKLTQSVITHSGEQKIPLQFGKNHNGFAGQIINEKGEIIQEFKNSQNQSAYELELDKLPLGLYSISRDDGGAVIKLTIK